MFVGHYAVALAAKRFAPKTSLGWSFIAVQFLDVLWAPLVIAGVEKARVVPGLLDASSLDLYYMPWTHSLVMALAWSWLVYRISKIPVLGVCVFSHWALDFIAHWHDLPLMKGGPYMGLGLWRWRAGTFGTEALLLVLGLLTYLRATRANGSAGRFAMPIFVCVLIAVNAANLYGPPPQSITAVAILAEVAYLVFAAAAAWLDRMRMALPPPETSSPSLSITEA